MKTHQTALLNWYETYGRHDLAWRNTTDIYHIYLSEIMLQQTQVSRVREEYYPKFLEKFPTLDVLAEAPLDEVLATWSGLGYYSRARNLHESAKRAKKGLPQEQKELLKLPGIGQYTASAICSFGLGHAIAVVDTNIARVIKRVFGLLNVSDKEVWAKAEGFVNAKAPREHNLALMDLGAIICTPTSPKCKECPLSQMCLGKDTPELYTQTKKTKYENLELFYGVFVKNNKIALVESSGNMYKGMLELPSVDPIEEDYIARFKHSYTKYRLDVKLYNLHKTPKDVVWVKLEEIEKAPISSLTKKAFAKIKF